MTSVIKKTNSPNVSFSMQEENELQRRYSHNAKKAEDAEKLVHYIDENIIGKGTSFCGPFGRRKVVYCDYSGCGRSLYFLEEHISREALPTHASACTGSSATSLQTRLYKREARCFAMTACGGGAGDFALLGADPPRVSRALGLSHAPHSQHPPVVFVGRGESERGRAPWRDLGATVIKIPETKEGFIDLNVLETKLQQHSKSGRKLIGYFAAASKLTGALADDVATTILLHQYGALAFWDYSLTAPNADINMNPSFPGVENDMVEKDAVFFNCEKFVGGVQAPLVAVVKKHIFKENSLYTDDLERLSECVEECDGTAAARAALVLQLRDAVGLQHIAAHNDAITRQVLSHIRNIPELILLGNDSPTVRRLPIFSLLVKHPRGTFLHHNFICAVLNDVFGIQARGGLSGNLSYGHELLGIDEQLFKEYEKVLNVDLQTHLRSKPGEEAIQHFEHLRPGFFRISLPFFTSESELAFILEALKMVATEGWKILPQYVVNPVNGQWRHHSNAVFKDRKSLRSIHYVDGKMISHERRISGPGIFPQTFTECLQTARNLFNQARKLAIKCSIEEQVITFNARIDYLRWFMLPKEAHDLLLGKSSKVKNIVPFDPFGYTGARKSLHTLCRSSHTSSPVFGSARHFSLSAIDDSLSALRAKQRQKYFSQEENVTEKETATQEFIIFENVQTAPVQFVVGGSVSPVNLRSQVDIPSEPQIMTRMRCYSLGSESPPTALSPQTRYKLGLSAVSTKKLDFCHCGSQTDLLSLDDPMISPRSSFGYNNPDSNSNSDCSQIGRISPPASSNSEELCAYVKEMTKEIATELKSEIREVISQVEDVLDNSDSLELSNLGTHSNTSTVSRDSVSVTDVAEYLMGVSREMASEVKYEIREMVNQVDEMISPDLHSSSHSSLNHYYRKSPPADPMRRRVATGTDLQLSLTDTSNHNPSVLRKCLTSPLLRSPNVSETPSENYFFNESKSPKRNGILLSPKSAQNSSPHDNVSFNSSETSTPETIIQVLSKDTVGVIPKSNSVTKFSDDERCCQETTCRPYCKNNSWSQYSTVSSHDSGINMTFPETDSFQTYVKCRTSSDPTGQKKKKQRYKSGCSLRRENSEVPDIIEGVPVCSGDYQACQQREGDKNRVAFQCDEISGDSRKSSRSSITESNSKRSSHSSLNGSESSDYSKNSSSYGTRSSPLSTASVDDPRSVDPSFCSQLGSLVDEDGRMSESGNSVSTSTDSSEYLFDEDSKWHCPPKAVWKSTVEAVHEFQMIRDQDKILVCLSGGQHSLALLHTLHQYQFYARAKGIHFSIGAIFVREPSCEIDPMHLMAYCRNLGVKFIYEDNKIDSQDLHSEKCDSEPASSCRWASHFARRSVYAAAARHGYTAAAVAQHLADVARAFLAAALHAGTLRAMKAHYFVREYDLRIVRPFIYVQEKCLQQFVESRHLPDFRCQSRLGLGSATRSDSPLASPDVDEQNIDTTDSFSSETPQPRDRSISAPQPASHPLVAGINTDTTKSRSRSEPAGGVAADLLQYHEKIFPCLFASLKSALHPLITSKNSTREVKEHRNRKKSVIQMKNGAPVYDSDEGTDEEAVP